MAITLEITTSSGLEVSDPSTTVTLNTAAVPASFLDIEASAIPFSGYGNITADNLEDAIKQLADNSFVQATIPTTNINEGDTWYNTDTNSFFVYREVASETFEWVPIMVGNDSPDSDTVDAGAF